MPQFEGFGCSATQLLRGDDDRQRHREPEQRGVQHERLRQLHPRRPGTHQLGVRHEERRLASSSRPALHGDVRQPELLGGQPGLQPGSAHEPGRPDPDPHARHAGRVPRRHDRPEDPQERLDDGLDRQRVRARPLHAGLRPLQVGPVRVPRGVRHCQPAREHVVGAHVPTSRTRTRSGTSSTASSWTRTSTARWPAPDDPTLDDDDVVCVPGKDAFVVHINGCFGADDDFDGPSYQNDWPGTNPDPKVDQKLHPQPVLFTSPTTTGGHNYPVINFEADLPAIERLLQHGHGCGLRQPAAGLAVLPLLLDPGRRCLLQLAGGRPVHPRDGERLRRELRRVRIAALDHVPGGRFHDRPAVRELQQRQPGQRLPCGLAKAKVRSDEGSGSAPLPSASKIRPQCC